VFGSSRTLQAGLRRVGWPAVFCDPLDLDRVEAKYLHVRVEVALGDRGAEEQDGFCAWQASTGAGDGESVRK
jgi:hypothetical protein